MTITVEILNAAGGKTVKVKGYHTGTENVEDFRSEGEIAPGEKKTFHLWDNKNLVLEEKKGGTL